MSGHVLLAGHVFWICFSPFLAQLSEKSWAGWWPKWWLALGRRTVLGAEMLWSDLLAKTWGGLALVLEAPNDLPKKSSSQVEKAAKAWFCIFFVRFFSVFLARQALRPRSRLQSLQFKRLGAWMLNLLSCGLIFFCLPGACQSKAGSPCSRILANGSNCR